MKKSLLSLALAFVPLVAIADGGHLPGECILFSKPKDRMACFIQQQMAQARVMQTVHEVNDPGLRALRKKLKLGDDATTADIATALGANSKKSD